MGTKFVEYEANKPSPRSNEAIRLSAVQDCKTTFGVGVNHDYIASRTPLSGTRSSSYFGAVAVTDVL